MFESEKERYVLVIDLFRTKRKGEKSWGHPVMGQEKLSVILVKSSKQKVLAGGGRRRAYLKGQKGTRTPIKGGDRGRKESG